MSHKTKSQYATYKHNTVGKNILTAYKNNNVCNVNFTKSPFRTAHKNQLQYDYNTIYCNCQEKISIYCVSWWWNVFLAKKISSSIYLKVKGQKGSRLQLNSLQLRFIQEMRIVCHDMSAPTDETLHSNDLKILGRW